MGKPMARNLKRAGADVVVHNRSQAPMEELAAEGMRVAATPAETAMRSGTVITMLTDTSALEKVIAGKSGVLEAAGPNTLVIDMSTAKMLTTKDLAARVKKCGGAYVDAPVSGGTMGAKQGTMSIMAGGDEAIEVFGDTPELWRAVISDQIMPDMRGMELIRRIKEIRPDVPCILCTGYSDTLTEETARAAGADAFFQKPVSASRLGRVLADLLGD